MSDRFVLDESIMKGALEGQPICVRVIAAIVQRCNSIVWNTEWLEKCYRPVARRAHASEGRHLLDLMKHALVWKGKMVQVTEKSPPLSDESQIHRKDIWLVRLAQASEACLVTTDRKLVEALRSMSLACTFPERVIER